MTRVRDEIHAVAIAIIGIILAVAMALIVVRGMDVPPSLATIIGAVVAGFLGPPRERRRE